MEVTRLTRLRKKLKNLTLNSSANSTVLVQFIKSILALSVAITDRSSFTTVSQDVKDWIASFKVIFPKDKIDVYIQKCIHKHSKLLTKLYFRFLQCFDKYEPSFIQEFYFHWTEILYCMGSSVRAECFIRYIDHFKLVTEHLEDAGHRCQQMTILKMLRIYTENVTYDDLKLADNDNHIIETIIKMRGKASLKEQHDIINFINVNNPSIITVKPTNVTPLEISSTFCDSEYDMWIDFNLKDDSVLFVAVSLTNENDHCMAIVPSPKVKQNTFMGSYVMLISGCWSLLQKNEPAHRIVKIMFISPIHIQDMISDAKNIFKFSQYDYADPKIEDVNRRLNKKKDSSDSDVTTVCLPPLSDSACGADSEEIPCKKSRIDNAAPILYRYDEFDSDCSENFSTSWNYILNEDSQEFLSETLPIPTDDHMNRDAGDSVTSNYDNEESRDDHRTFNAEFNENTDEYDEQDVNLQMLGTNTVVTQENNGWHFQQMEVQIEANPSLVRKRLFSTVTVSSSTQNVGKFSVDMDAKVPEENNVLQSQQIEVRASLSTRNVSNYTQDDGKMPVEVRSHNFSIVEETVNDLISETNSRPVQSERNSCHSNDKRDGLATRYSKRLRSKNLAKEEMAQPSNVNEVSSTVRKRKRKKTSRVTVFPQNQIEQSLKRVSECRDQISEIHGEFVKYLDKYIERLQTLLANRRNFV